MKKLLEEPITEEKKMSIHYDKKQYSIRIPKEFIETIKETIGKPEKLKFKFTLIIPSPESKEQPTLKGELINE